MKCFQLFIVGLCLVFAPITIQAQDTMAEIGKSGNIILPNDLALQASYSIDIARMNFDDELVAVEYFRERSDNLHFYRPVLSQNKAVLYLQLKERPDWNLSQWNNYLQSKRILDVQIVPVKKHN